MLSSIGSSTWEIINGVTGIVSVLATIILTFIIILQSRKLNKKQILLETNINNQQQKFQERINAEQLSIQSRIHNQQLEVQKRQLRVDAFSYRRDIFLHACSILEFSNLINRVLIEKKLEIRNGDHLYGLIKTAEDSIVHDSRLAILSLRESEYIFSRDTADKLLDIRVLYDNTIASVSPLKFLDEHLTGDQMREQIDFVLNRIETNTKGILKYTTFIFDVLPREFHISDIEM